jgi:hypothetical protein
VKKAEVSELGSSDDGVSSLDQLGQYNQALADINNHDYLVYAAAYERGYRNGRDYEAKMHSGLELSTKDVLALKKFSNAIGYISHTDHEDFLSLLQKLEEVDGTDGEVHS